jgi:ATP-binding cassette subfamily F protein uup
MAIEWLEIYLKSYRGAVVCVSHDKTFLANISNRIFWLDRGALKVCQKGFGYFDEWSNILFEQEARELHNREKILEGELEWANRGVKARVKRNQRRLALVKAERDKLKADTSAFKRATQTIELKEFGDNIETSSNIRAEFYNVHKSFVQDNVTKTILKGFSLRILKGDRIGILGRNGSGKSTFLKLLIDELKPDLGTIKRSKTLQISYFDQKRSDLKENVTIKEILCRGDGDYIEVAGKQRHVCGYLKDFMFDPKRVNDLVSNLSGGQQNRLLLAKVLAEPGNFMILDEPTNDLDMDTLDMLEELLSHYKGTLIIVSHDRDFLDQTVTKILAFEGDGKVELNIGGYSDYLEYKQSKTESGIKNNSPEINVNPKETQQQDKFKTLSKLSYKFQFELEQLPKKIAEKEEEIKILETLLSDSTLYTENSEKYNFATRKYQQAKKDLVRLEDRWIELEMMNNS